MTASLTSILGDYGPGKDVMVRYVTDGEQKPLDKCGNKVLGGIGEDLAAQYLTHYGYDVIDRNWRCCFGEVDIIAENDNAIILVEVKTRRQPAPCTTLAPELAVDSRKRSRYQKLALMYLSKQTRIDTVRFDVVAVNVFDEHAAQLRHLCSAYEWDY